MIIIMVGAAGVGKSTLAREIASKIGALVVSSDATRALFGRSESDFSKEPLVWRYVEDLVERAVLDGLHVIVDSTALLPSLRKPYVKIAKRHGVGVTAVVIDVPVSVAVERNRKRALEGGRSVPDEAIERHCKKLVYPTYAEGFDSIEYS